MAQGWGALVTKIGTNTGAVCLVGQTVQWWVVYFFRARDIYFRTPSASLNAGALFAGGLHTVYDLCGRRLRVWHFV